MGPTDGPNAASSTSTGPTTMPRQTPTGMRKNGKQWHAPRMAFRPTAGQTPYAKRMAQRAADQATRARESQMKADKAAERERRVQAIRDRRLARAEKERYEKMAEKLHRKVVERRRRREKRNKLLASGK